jgi:hypothetical protein
MFYVDLTRPSYLQANKGHADLSSNNIHDELAFTLCNEILRNPDADHIKAFVKMLLYLQVHKFKPPSFLNEFSRLTENFAHS